MNKALSGAQSSKSGGTAENPEAGCGATHTAEQRPNIDRRPAGMKRDTLLTGKLDLSYPSSLQPLSWITWLPRLLTGENSCEWAIWFKAHFQDWTKPPSDFDQAE